MKIPLLSIQQLFSDTLPKNATRKWFNRFLALGQATLCWLTVRNSSSIPFKVPKRSVVVAFNHNYRQDRQCVGNYFQVLIWLFSFFFFTSTTWELSHLHLGLSLHEVADYFLNWWLLFLISQISTDDRISSAAISGQEFPRRVVLGRWIVHSPGMRQVGWFDNYIYVDVANRVL